MIRALIDKFRAAVLGPNLVKFARMPKEDLNQIIMLGSDDFLFDQLPEQKIATQPGAPSLPSEDVQELRKELSHLRERLETLERVFLSKASDKEERSVIYNKETYPESEQRQTGLS